MPSMQRGRGCYIEYRPGYIIKMFGNEKVEGIISEQKKA
jgi:hypothetical protein